MFLQSAAAAQEKENAVSVKTKNSGKVGDSHAVPRKAKTLTSGASPRLKKALGQISLNSPRANQRVAASSLSKKPLISSAAASAPEKTTPQVTLCGPGASSEDASTATEVRQNSEAADTIAGVDVALGRPSMMVETANPRLQEVPAPPRGKVVRVKLFAEKNEDEEEDEPHDEGQSSAAAAGAAAAATAQSASESAGNEDAKEQLNQGAYDEAVEDRSEAAESPQQDREEGAVSVDNGHDKTEAASCEQDIVPPAGPSAGGKEQVETPGSSLLPAHEQDKGEQQQQREDVAAFPSEEAGPDIAEKEAAAGSGATTTLALELSTAEQVVAAKETAADVDAAEWPTAASVIEEKSQEDECLGYAAPAPPSNEPVDGEDDLARVSAQQLNEVAVATAKAPEGIQEAAGAVPKEATSYTRSEENRAIAVDGPQHVGLVVDEETRELVEGSKYLQFADDERRVLCTLTGKKIAPVYDGILLHLGSRKVQQLMVEGAFVMAVSTPKQ